MNYIIATIRPWNTELFQKKIKEWGSNWYLITKKDELTINLIKKINPRYIFFPHWSWIIPKEIYENYECIGFHCSDLPYGRGGSPLQNLIVLGHKESAVTAFRITKDVDAGDIYLKKYFSLNGLAEEIYVRMSKIIAEMIENLTETKHIPYTQKNVSGEPPKVWIRRTPEQSEILRTETLERLFSHIRMLDAEDYPRAFINYGKFKLTFGRPALRTGKIVCDVIIEEKR